MRFRRPSPATVIASIALFVSLGGVSYGVATGSIDSREIKNSTIKSRDIKNSAILGKDIKNGTVRARDLGVDVSGVEAFAVVTRGVPPSFIGDRKGFTAVNRPAGSPVGVYCLSVASGVPTTGAMIATARRDGSSAVRTFVLPLVAGVSRCAAGQREVHTFGTNGGATNNASFSVLIP